MRAADPVLIHFGFVCNHKLLTKLLCVMQRSCPAAIQKQLSLMKNGEGGLSIFVGLNGTKEELGLKADNYWIFSENNFDELCVLYLLI